jgi:hypothetical protein
VNGNTYTNGRGTVVEVEVVDAGSVEDGSTATTVEVVTEEVGGSVVGADAALSAAHPATNAQSAPTDDRAVTRRITGDLPLRP